MKIVLKRGTQIVIPTSSQFDPYLQIYKKVTLRRGNRSLLQRFKIWYFRRELKKVGGI